METNTNISHLKGARNTTRKVLTLKESLALNAIVVANYTSSGLNNQQFADSINNNPTYRSKFSFDVVAGHVASAIEAADIPNNRLAAAASGNVALTIRVQELEEQMTRVLKRLSLPTTER